MEDVKEDRIRCSLCLEGVLGGTETVGEIIEIKTVLPIPEKKRNLSSD